MLETIELVGKYFLNHFFAGVELWTVCETYLYMHVRLRPGLGTSISDTYDIRLFRRLGLL